MELKFSEISDAQYIVNNKPYQYWNKEIKNDNEISIEKTKRKKKVSFDDILCNMNLVVNQNGILQQMTSNKDIEEQNFIQSNPNYLNIVKEEPLDPNVKHSYIYNKYFKDYHDVNRNTPLVRVPKTMEEYKQMLLDDRIKAIEHRKRIAEIKSKKLFFTNNSSIQRNNTSTATNLRNMNFR